MKVASTVPNDVRPEPVIPPPREMSAMSTKKERKPLGPETPAATWVGLSMLKGPSPTIP
ncbi:hypothetical protein D3C72_1964260 [compost metagenome]